MTRNRIGRSVSRLCLVAMFAIAGTSGAMLSSAGDDMDPCIGHGASCNVDSDLGPVCAGVSRTDPNCPLTIVQDGTKWTTITMSTGLMSTTPVPVTCKYFKTKRPVGGGPCEDYGVETSYTYSGRQSSGNACPSGGTCTPEE